MQHALGHHAHGRVVHLCKCNRYLQMRTQSIYVWRDSLLRIIAVQWHGYPVLCRASQQERPAQPRAVPRKQGMKKQ